MDPRRIKVTGATHWAASTMAMALAAAPMPVAMTETGRPHKTRYRSATPGCAAELPPDERPGDLPGPVRVAAGEDVGSQVAFAAVKMVITALAVFGEVDVGHGVFPSFPKLSLETYLRPSSGLTSKFSFPSTTWEREERFRVPPPLRGGG